MGGVLETVVVFMVQIPSCLPMNLGLNIRVQGGT